jgi:hypothetical protein
MTTKKESAHVEHVAHIEIKESTISTFPICKIWSAGLGFIQN